MTKEEAIAYGEDYLRDLSSYAACKISERHVNFVKMALAALKAEPCEMRDATEQERKSIDDYVKSISRHTGFNVFNEPCEDAVSREAVLDALHVEGRPTKRFDYVIEVKNDIMALPPVTPKPAECDDAISRQAVFDMAYLLDDSESLSSRDVVDVNDVEGLPPVTPKPTECEDAIDRCALRARFNHLDEVYEGMSEEEEHEAYIYGQIIRAIDAAPPVVPKQRTGKWYKVKENTYRCNVCGRIVHKDAMEDMQIDYPYCHCGAKMEGEGE